MYQFPYYQPKAAGTAVPQAMCLTCHGTGTAWRLVCLVCHGCGKVPQPKAPEKKD